MDQSYASQNRPEPGLVMLHSNRQETLKSVLVEWLANHPLDLFDKEEMLVQSNGIGQWIKFALAEDREQGGVGIAANIQFSLPSMFIWRAYRAVLGEEAVPKVSPFDKPRLSWRLFRLLNRLPQTAPFEPLIQFLKDDSDQQRRWQLAQQLADLYDQYQIYRGDWLNHWAEGGEQVTDAQNRSLPLAADDCWQSLLWQFICDDLGLEQSLSRPVVHQRFLQICSEGHVDRTKLPKRLIIFGVSSLPKQALEAIDALSQHIQILFCVLNPCKHYWADIIDGRDLLTAKNRRQLEKPAEDLFAIEHPSQPLLAAWGKQGRDFVRLLDLYDESHSFQSQFGLNRIDLFEDEATPNSLLHQIQHDILELESPQFEPRVLASGDQSLRFVEAYSAQREVDILQDQLISALRDDPSLRPRDILVMVPNVDDYRAQIESVFGRLSTIDERFIPFSISDQSRSSTHSMIGALERLLTLNTQRMGVTVLFELLDVPAIRRKFQFDTESLATLQEWINDAGVRWGLNAQHRSLLGVTTGIEQNSWLFGLRRLLTGYALGESDGVRGVVPLTSVKGVSANAVGSLAQLLRVFSEWASFIENHHTLDLWVERIERLMTQIFDCIEPDEQMIESSLLTELKAIQERAASAEVSEPVPLHLFSQLLLDALDAPDLNRRFMSGGVTFATLMPMRAIPFKRIYLLGMQDGAYPRPQVRNDFDLMARSSLFRPGDRSRRDDDRYLFLEALLSARESLSISWVGRSAVDNSERPPSVLVAQLRDFIDAHWVNPDKAVKVLELLTDKHPLQPFAQDYFDQNSALITFAHEWQAVHQPDSELSSVAASVELDLQLSIDELNRFYKAPARYYYHSLIGTSLPLPKEQSQESEPFVISKLDDHLLKSAALELLGYPNKEDREVKIESVVDRLKDLGTLPWGGYAEKPVRAIKSHLGSICRHLDWLTDRYDWQQQDSLKLHLALSGATITGETGALYQLEKQWATVVKLSGAAIEKGTVKQDRMLGSWPKHLLLNACLGPTTTYFIGPDAVTYLKVVESHEATRLLEALDQARREMLESPKPIAARTSLVLLNKGESQAATQFEGEFTFNERQREPELAQLWESYEQIKEAGLAEFAARLYSPLIDYSDIWREGSR
ncbi:RecBCD enzyme subunit RecC [Marinobacterium sp. xm-g-59]|uniref:exodeoxyribonuclease V subunit gamma n=1 Tax=Marinobacterium sp. xm-g-59 TaxID=2497748 RepID=UPI001569724D|nr:exodeoxyribonuclease V subunit gamma [Marinobacterium sp. xm-g-59]NRP94095.1 RecBCD enzyme subunit RecC [Marinobacterium sp. xm-g-59]